MLCRLYRRGLVESGIASKYNGRTVKQGKRRKRVVQTPKRLLEYLKPLRLKDKCQPAPRKGKDFRHKTGMWKPVVLQVTQEVVPRWAHNPGTVVQLDYLQQGQNEI